MAMNVDLLTYFDWHVGICGYVVNAGVYWYCRRKIGKNSRRFDMLLEMSGQ